MRISQTSRRNFLSSLAILSAGSALGSVTRFFHETETGLQQQWKQFCFRNGGYPYQSGIALENGVSFNRCKGHFYKAGEPVYFSSGDLVAVPVWVCWGVEKAQPDDVIVTFLQREGQQKIGRINRFELEALTAMADEDNVDQLLLLKKITQRGAGAEKKGYDIIKTRIQRGKDFRILVNTAGKQTTIEKTIIYNA